MQRLLLLTALALTAPAARGQTATFTPLGDLPGGTFASYARGVSADGAVVVGTGSSALDPYWQEEAFRWESGTMQGLGRFLNDEHSHARATSADGSVVVGYSGIHPDVRERAFRWTEADGMVALGNISCCTKCFGNGVSDDGSVSIGSCTNYRFPDVRAEAVLWNPAAGVVSLGDLPGGRFDSGALGVSADGNVIVGYGYTASGFEAFRWSQGTGMVGLGDLPGGGVFSMAFGVSADGLVVVGRSAGALGHEAFRWESGGMTGLGDLPGGEYYSSATAASANGVVVVGGSRTAQSGSDSEAFLWTADGGMRNLREVLEGLGLDLSGWTLRDATDISSDGTVIVGYGTNPQGAMEGWRATLPVPTPTEPSSEPLVASLAVNPNPSRGETIAALTLGSAAAVRVAVYDALGREVAVVHDSPLPAGEHRLAFDASRLAPGVYVVSAVAGAWRSTARLVVPDLRAR